MRAFLEKACGTLSRMLIDGTGGHSGATADEAAPPAAAHQVRRSSLKDSVGLYIRDLIFNGDLVPGERIDQDAVAGDSRGE